MFIPFSSMLLMLITPFLIQHDFIKDQKRYPRVRAAIAEKGSIIQQQLESNELAIDDFHILLVAYKDEGQLVVYGKASHESTYKQVAEYEICSRSGVLGPKRGQGDYQVPEGFYYIDRFNPASDFHLSLGLNYPNLADRRKGTFDQLGGDIFIHGACVTIGCLPMTDDKIKEIYLYAVHARNNGQPRIPVYAYPFKMTDENMATYAKKYANEHTLLEFWSNLKLGYDHFIQNKQEVRFSVSANGDYQFN